MSYEARIERDSITQYGERLTTVVATFPRIVLAEANTHRMFSRSSASSRAIPVEKQIARLREDPFYPVYWGKNQKGMQADQELTPEEIAYVKGKWIDARDSAIDHASVLMDRGVHKQITNRLLEPFMWHTVIISSTEWGNFEHLRVNKHAQPEFKKSAEMVMDVIHGSIPKLVSPGAWHLPFTDAADAANIEDAQLVQVSAGRSARVSYMTHDGKRDPKADVTLAMGLLQNGHMAPWEHPARPMSDREREIFGRDEYTMPANWPGGITDPYMQWKKTGKRTYFLGNFNGWVQARKLIHGEQDILAFER